MLEILRPGRFWGMGLWEWSRCRHQRSGPTRELTRAPRSVGDHAIGNAVVVKISHLPNFWSWQGTEVLLS